MDEPPVATVTRAKGRRSRLTALAAAVAAMATVVVLALTLLSDTPVSGAGGSTRVALIRMWDPGPIGGEDEQGWAPFVEGLQRAERSHELTTEMIDLFPRRPPEGGFAQGSDADVRRLSARLTSGDFDLVLWPLGLTGPRFYDVVREHPDTRFVFLDYCCVQGPELGGSANATSLTLKGEQAAHLAGYLSGLVEARRPIAKGARHMVSMVIGEPNFAQEQAWARGFATGAQRALPGVDVRTDYSYDYDHRRVCEEIANEQIDAGSGVVFAAAGDCGLGALRAAGIRGTWAVASDEDRSHLGPHILASATKRFDRLVETSVGWYLEDRLPPGGDVSLGLIDDAVALVGISPEVSQGIRRQVAQEAARLQAQQTPEPS